MAYVSYRKDNHDHVGVLEDDSVIPLSGVTRIGPDTGTNELASAERDISGRTPISSVTLLPASPRPARILCVGLNYHDHINETGREIPQYPVLFPKFASNLVAANDDIALPAESHQVDYECELAVVIGKRGRRIPQEEAYSHVLGYTVANDVTMRDYQYKTHQWLQGKAWDKSTPLGPVIVTPDEADISNASIRTILNGDVMQESNLSHLIFTIPRLIADISEFTELEPGDVILTGTPGGVGYRRDPQVFLKPGDVVSVEIEKIGRIDNKIIAETV
ncbi:2-hydroxyhepta-2,4-diene-1,7-dioate isomerase [Arthrobacter sp. 9V]|uniref:fumarylacetoacetate hydrolase family protein n=1 Tax=Arthrobacter sp. 9V TaxID=2653132 RepID=UPI0012F13E9B|nr:fumarylacetoacetate hydrolase family protein [Arthrobacter sp. 9V]VXC43577.1 2-hydroxyhepta-2,4-diene-1,7-dioate isomerase [Arthrobacter sp. 9V]